jgi:hypothetical protein
MTILGSTGFRDVGVDRSIMVMRGDKTQGSLYGPVVLNVKADGGFPILLYLHHSQ